MFDKIFTAYDKIKAYWDWKIMKSGLIKYEDLSTISKQIGREPRGDIKVGCRCVYGHPTVIITPPVIDGVVFPTTYWLSCPDLVKKVSQLEDLGFISQFKEKLVSDNDWQERLEASTIAQITMRRQIDKSYSCNPRRGIAGVVDMAIIKCLHAHLADYLVSGINPIGREVSKMVAELDDNCERERLKC